MTESEEVLERYSSVLEQLATSPFERSLYLERIQLAKELGLNDEVENGRNDFADHFPLSEAEWSEWIDDEKSHLSTTPAQEVEPFMNVIELYRRANRDYLSIPLLTSFSTWTVSNYYLAQGIAQPSPAIEAGDEDEAMELGERRTGEPDPLLSVVFSLEAVREICQEVLAIGGVHMSESAKLWAVWRNFETDLLIVEKTPDQLVQVEALYRARLKVPHLGIKQTFDDYSSFVTKFDNDNYEQSLPAASKIYSATTKKVDEREMEEIKLKNAGYSAQAYLDYIGWEREVKRPDVPLVKALFDRATKDHPNESEIWETYIEFEWKLSDRSGDIVQVAEQSIRHNPANALLWSNYFRVSEKLGQGSEGVEGLFARAMATKLFEKDMDSTVSLYHARAAFHRRELDRSATEDEEGGPNADMVGLVLGVLAEGIAKTKEVHHKGDKQHRLEKFMIRIYERFQMHEEAGKMWEDLTNAEPWSYATWYGRADFETRAGRYQQAHEVYVQGCSARGLDYPEYLIEPWLTFERECGTFEDLQFALVKAKRQKKGLEKRRAKEAQQAAAAYAAAQPVAAAATDAPSSTTDADSFIAAAVNSSTNDSDSHKKRERSPQDETQGAAKKVKVESTPSAAPAGPSEPKRDREHSTVFAISSGAMSEEDVGKLFEDCGEVRECKVKVIDGKSYAMLEFMEKESVLAAQTKDKKRINESEVEVHIAWQSCLYVTNFPESFDKAAVEKLFEKYGVIFDTRWPSKRFKNTRRFCYVQFANPAHAQAALELNGTELEPGHRLGVFVSDPSRKKSRTDTGANNRELYVSSLAKFVKEEELRRMFEPFGTLKGLRLVTDDKGECKGFAFVEYEDEASAQAALSLNNHELRKRRMAVTIAQSRATGTAKSFPTERRTETENRSIRVRGLIPGTDEAIVQQTFEKFAPVQRVVYEVGETEAIVMFENAADVGKILLQRDTIQVDSTPVEIFADGKQIRSNVQTGGSGGNKKTASSTSNNNNGNNTDHQKSTGGVGGDVPLMPRQASRGRGRVGLAGGRGGGRGRGRGGIGSVSATTTSTPSASTTPNLNSTGAQGAGGEANAATKSQDDFRAMLMKK